MDWWWVISKFPQIMVQYKNYSWYIKNFISSLSACQSQNHNQMYHYDDHFSLFTTTTHSISSAWAGRLDVDLPDWGGHRRLLERALPDLRQGRAAAFRQGRLLRRSGRGARRTKTEKLVHGQITSQLSISNHESRFSLFCERYRKI